MEANNSKKSAMQTLLPLLIMGLGMLLMAFMIYTESEPGALPLLLIVVGAVGYSSSEFGRGRRPELNKFSIPKSIK